MRRLFVLVSGVALTVLPYASLVNAQEVTNGMNADKDECLLVAKNCSSDSIQERISRIQGEIAKGTDVYTADELKRLEHELQTEQNLHNFIENEERPVMGEGV